VADAQHGQSVDNRLVTIPPISVKSLRKEGLDWFVNGENHDYLSEEYVQVTPAEVDAFREATKEVHRLGIEAAQLVASRNAWEEAGIPKAAINLVKYSLENELENHLVGRYDFSGGLEGMPIKLLEFNADTCSLMCETAYIQEMRYEQESRKLNGRPFNNLVDGLARKFRNILHHNPSKEPTLLISTLGNEEDMLNVRAIEKAAYFAGFEHVAHEVVENVTFSPDEGIFIEEDNGEFSRFDFWYKFMPWEIIAYEEEELWEILETIITNDLCVVLNPAYTMLLQSKAIMKFMYELAPNLKYNLKTSFKEGDFPDRRYVRKPMFGRMGDNIAFYDGNRQPEYETEGDYGDYPPVYQELADFNADSEEHRYQPSIFWTGMSSALCFRRQDDLIIDDDAEFVGHVVE
jgi:glutathionylspermidine synthase